MHWKFKLSLFQWSLVSYIKSLKSLIAGFPNPSVCVDNTAVGSGHTWFPIEDNIGIIVANAALP